MEQLPPLYPGWPTPSSPERPRPNLFVRIFIGPKGLRSGWSLVLFGVVWIVIAIGDAVFFQVQNHTNLHSPIDLFILEYVSLQTTIGAAVVVAYVDGRQAKDFFLTGSRPLINFAKGVAVGAVSMSIIALLLYAGGWQRVTPPTGSPLLWIGNGLLWSLVFLTLACFEEGLFRGFLQSTIMRGVNFWAALTFALLICFGVFLWQHLTAASGATVTLALVGLIPALIAKLRRRSDEAFWAAAWLTSTLFGAIHSPNAGETYVGIVDAGIAGYGFCVAIKVTGSIWWSIGSHAAWDWMQTYLLGSPDSGVVASGHLLTTAPAGSPLWSGGATGPEGSVIGLAVDIAIIAALVICRLRVRNRSLQQNPLGRV